MRKAEIYWNGKLAGTITELNRGNFIFRYDDLYYSNTELPPASLTLPKTQKEYYSPSLFPFLYNMLSEGANKRLQNRLFKIDENDHFGLLLATEGSETIGALSIKNIII